MSNEPSRQSHNVPSAATEHDTADQTPAVDQEHPDVIDDPETSSGFDLATAYQTLVSAYVRTYLIERADE